MRLRLRLRLGLGFGLGLGLGFLCVVGGGRQHDEADAHGGLG